MSEVPNLTPIERAAYEVADAKRAMDPLRPVAGSRKPFDSRPLLRANDLLEEKLTALLALCPPRRR